MTGADQPATAAGDGGPPAARVSPWSPFGHPLFAAMWGAQFVSNIGSWMQTVAAQWLMLTLTSSAVYVALIQTAAGLPVVLFAILAGTIGDLVDRRRLLLFTQMFMLAAAAALGALAIAGLVTPWVLLALVFAVGTGQALTSPTWQTLQPELVSPAERVQAISLGSVNQNLARAVGPALGGVLLAATSAGPVFLINAASFAAVIAVIAAWHSTRAPSALPREHVGEAVRAAGRYVAASPVLRVILARAGLFIFFASAIWALLPLTAHSVLHLGSGGYGLLLGSVGLGAVAGAVALPRLRTRLSPDAMLAVGSVGLAAVTLLLAYAHVTAVDAAALVVGGACWVVALSTLSSLYQLSLPQWIKARGMSFYLMVFQGGNAVGSAVMGLAAEHAGLSPTLAIAAAGLALGALAGLAWRFQSIPPQDLLPAGDWPSPQLAADQAPDGPVLVSVEYWAQPGFEDELMTALEETRYSRRRTGATEWRAWRDASNTSRILEQFVVASWDEHLLQHQRVTKRDQDRLDRVRQMTDPARPVTITHWLAATPRKAVTAQKLAAHLGVRLRFPQPPLDGAQPRGEGDELVDYGIRAGPHLHHPRLPMAVEHLDHPLAGPVQVGAEPDQHLRGDPVALADQAEQDVLGADVVVAELQRLAQRQLEHLLGPRGERDVPGRRLLAPADDLLDLLPDRVQADAERLQRLGRDALALVDQAEQDVLGADVVVIEHPGFFLRQDHDPPRPVGKPLEHRPLRKITKSAVRQARTAR